MKKNLIIIGVCILIVLLVIGGRIYGYRVKYSEIKEFNLQFESYLDREVYGAEVATIINKAIDNNDKNNVAKEEVEQDENKYYFYIPNDENSIKIDIQIIDNNTTYQMESIYQGQIINFVQNYDHIKFKCTKIEYNSAKRVSYMFFEQITK